MDILRSNSFYFSPDDVSTLLDQKRCSIYQLLNEFVSNVKQKANIPISEFSVGAAAYGASGAIYCGVNIEMKYISMGQVIHAEQCAITNALLHFPYVHETEIKILAVSETPCGHCRQFLQELPFCQNLEIYVPSKNIQSPLSSLLPYSFELPIDGRLWKVFEEPTVQYQLNTEQLKIWSEFCKENKIENTEEILNYSLTLLNHSFAPYTKSKSSVCLIEKDSKYFYGGMTIESAAYNPTMTATQSSIVSLITNERSMNDVSFMLVIEIKEAVCNVQDSAVTLSHALHRQTKESETSPIAICHLTI